EQLKQMYNAHPRAKKETTMTDLRFQALHFDATDQLKEFAEKKITKLSRLSDEITGAETILKLIKPDTAQNKEASIRLYLPGEDLFAEKTADTFEEAIDLSIDALKRQLEKRKEQRK
ncbi:ribosome hibernation-promoting factor, HPF/YfiA family, partial [Bacteroides heparinolyticus]